jgi:glycosyltransferase involved in cell wall biosynthesis
MLRNGQLPRLIFYLKTYSTQFEKVYIITYDEEDMQSLLPPRCFHLHTGNLLAGKFLYPLFAPLVFQRELRESDIYRVLGLFLRSMIPSIISSLIYTRPIVATYQYRYSEFARIEGRSPLIVFLTRLKEKVGLHFSTRIIVTTHNLKEYVSKQLKGKDVWLVPNGVIFEFFSKKKRRTLSKGSDRNILFVGRLTSQKNVLSLLQAIHNISNVRLTIIGEGPLRREIFDYSEELGLNVRFEGYVPHSQLEAYYHAADIFVLPSFIEGHPKVLLEAMACGLPVVGTDVEGTREIIVHEHNGLLCGTDPSSLRIALERLLEDPELATRLGENAQRLMTQEYGLKMLLSRETDLMVDLVLSQTE